MTWPSESFCPRFVGTAATAQPPSVVQLAPNVQIPQTLQYSLGIDHQLRKTTTLSVTYTGSQGYHLFRSRDINAPPPPFYLSRPDSAYGVVREVESDGRQTTDSLQVTVRGDTSPNPDLNTGDDRARSNRTALNDIAFWHLADLLRS